MANWAIVIGIDEYWTANACLRGGVRDALEMREWLLDPAGGAVPPANLLLLLGPSALSPVPPGLNHLAANQATIIDAIRRVVQKSGGKGERLFFHYSGHGLMARWAGRDEEALAPSDFSDRLSIRSLGLDSVTEYFEGFDFPEQFFFIDACRNIPWTGEFRIGYFPDTSQRDAKVAAPQQFIFYATSPGVKAAEIAASGNERGAFTSVLLQGLRCSGKAKLWAPASLEYVVRVDSLYRYVKDEVSTLKMGLQDAVERDLVQVPRLGGERGARGDNDPILGRISADEVPDVSLDVDVDPGVVAPQTSLTVERDGKTIDSRHGVSRLPARFPLKPREYAVLAEAPRHRPEKERWIADLYSPLTVQVRLIPGLAAPPPRPPLPVGGPPPPGPTPGLHAPPAPGLGRGAGVPGSRPFPAPARATGPMPGGGGTAVFEPAPRTADMARLGAISIRSPDSLSALELADSGGRVLAKGLGALECFDLESGFYRARLASPEGDLVEQVVELRRGEREEVTLTPPPRPESGAVRSLISQGSFLERSDNTIEVSETLGLGPLAAPSLSTILTLAGSVATFPREQLGAHRLRMLGLRTFREAVVTKQDCGLRVLLGVDAAGDEDPKPAITNLGLRSWPLGAPVPEETLGFTPFSGADGVGEYSAAAEAGMRWLSIEAPGGNAIVLPVALMPKRVSMVVLHRDAERHLRIFHFLPALTLDEASHPASLRRIEQLQRYLMGGRLDYAHALAEELLETKWIDPIAGTLGGYLLIKLGRVGDLSAPAHNMTMSFGELSDSWILLGALHEAEGRMSSAASAYREALQRGLPLCADGIVRLASAVDRHSIRGPQAGPIGEMARSRVRGSLWSWWSPEGLSPGVPFESQEGTAFPGGARARGRKRPRGAARILDRVHRRPG